MTSEINYIFDLKYLGSGQVTFRDDATGKIIEKEKNWNTPNFPHVKDVMLVDVNPNIPNE